MKPFIFDSIESVRGYLPGRDAVRHGIVEHEPSGTKLYPYEVVDGGEVSAVPGDLIVRYADEAALHARYRRAIRTLDWDASLEERFGDPTQAERFRDALMHRLQKVKLWNYAPEKRDDVKAARAFLRRYLTQKVPYGRIEVIGAEEMDDFLADEARRFGVETFHYAVAPEHALPWVDALEGVVMLGKEVETQIETSITEALTPLNRLVEGVRTRVGLGYAS
jgi:hypothetical protein